MMTPAATLPRAAGSAWRRCTCAAATSGTASDASTASSWTCSPPSSGTLRASRRAAADGRWRASACLTDETDAAYLRGLLSRPDGLPGWKGRVHHGDVLVAQQLQRLGPSFSADNYLLFSVAEELMGGARSP